MKIPVVYVAGPYRAPTRAGVELNIHAARKLGAIAAEKGCAPLIPHSNTSHFDEYLPAAGDKFWLDATLELLRRCDAVVLCPGWARSNGTLAEISEARRLKLPIFETDSELPMAAQFVKCPLAYGRTINWSRAGA
jgi:nucleoside 2-deoxyribosyltransferase